MFESEGEVIMIELKRVKKSGGWDYSGGCQSCNENNAEMNRFTLSNGGSMGWTVRICDNCMHEMQLMWWKEETQRHEVPA